jgi:hypothetical protein
MIFNVYNLIRQIRGYASRTPYSSTIMGFYVLFSILSGVLLSIEASVSDVPLLTAASILFGFSVNALVLLSNSAEKYVSDGTDFGDHLEELFKKTLYISVHTLGVGLFLILITAINGLAPEITFMIYGVDAVEAFVFALATYYFMSISIVVVSVAELVHIQVSTT